MDVKENVICLPISIPIVENCSRSVAFDYNNQGDFQVMDLVGKSVFNLCNVVSNGLVVFFTSYNYLEKCLCNWKETSLYDQIGVKKKVFIEVEFNIDLLRV